MTNYGFESRMFFDSSMKNNQRSTKERVLTRKNSDIINKMKNIWDFIKKKLANAQNMQKRYANQKRTSSSEYKFENMIWLFIKNIKIERSFRKLDHKWIESYKIKKVLRDACRLELSSSMKIHDTFHIFLLQKTTIDSLIEQIQSSSSSIVIDEEEKYEINDILDSRYHYDKLQYRVVWIDHSSDRAWYLAENFQKHSKEILIDYHQRYSDKSRSELRLIASIASMTDHFYWLQQAKNLVKNTLNKMQTKMKDNQKEFNKDSFVTNVLIREELWISAY
jgi:predicted metal-dependent hydrolase